MNRYVLFLALAACGAATPEPAEAPAAADKTAEAPPAAEAPAADAPVARTGWETFGNPFEVSEAVTAKALLADPAPHVGKKLMVEGEVADVCQKAGCWMVVTDGAKNIRVRMKDHDFAVAKDCTGSTARVHGEVVAHEVKAEEVAHFEGEAANPDVMPEKQLPADATVTYELIASAVQIKR